jgi:YidC/Oxa1 family membrane protein insertase
VLAKAAGGEATDGGGPSISSLFVRYGLTGLGALLALAGVVFGSRPWKLPESLTTHQRLLSRALFVVGAAVLTLGLYEHSAIPVATEVVHGPRLGDMINLGFFSPVAKVLVGVLVFFQTHVTMGNWGLAIIAMTVSLRMLMLPLSIKPIKTSIAMRRLKPEIDAVSEKFKDDMQAKNMAMMELYRKHGVNPLGGCLPQLVQMPIWFAMYTTLQTAVEMYHEKFLWFTDLSAPDKFYVLPIVLGGFMILQQRVVPQQGMDPTQQKIMMYMLPGVFTVMMLFLPAALGVYMLTNSVLGIAQQLVVERIAPRNAPKNARKGEITVRQAADKSDAANTFGKGKARV